MLELFENQLIDQNRKSSKGNQLKWQQGEIWFKADYTGYEGMAEYVISHLLQKSSLMNAEYVLYDVEEIKYRTQIFMGCKSKNFLKGDWQIITLERLFQSFTGESLSRCIYKIVENEDRLKFLVEQTERITGLKNFGEYMSKLLTIDSFFLNEDRHTHNIAVLMNGMGEYKCCPIFDNGAGLLSDTKMDYPLKADVYELEELPKSKTLGTDFDEQLIIAEKLYGQKVKFCFTRHDVEEIVNATPYSDEIKKRIVTVILGRMRKYSYLFE